MSEIGVSPATPQPPVRGPLAALGWACFLGSSWTWIIGMVFPILLLRDYGVTGWWVFAIPNVIGAAAMGFVLARPEVSTRVFDNHTGMCVRFSEATLAFHFFVATWLFTQLLGGWWPVPAVIVLGLGFWAVSVRDRGAVLASVAVTLASLVLFGVLLTTDGAWSGVGQTGAADASAALPEGAVWFFALASLTGFALCPYLDATFHRARQATAAGTGKAAFAIGFGVVFFAMIIFTLAYAGQLIPWLDPGATRELPPMWGWILGTHLLLQSGLTIGLHLREANENPLSYRLSPRLAVVALVGVGLGLMLQDAPVRLTDDRSLADGEVIYRCFLLLYGLVFPAYVFLVMLPPMKRGGGVSRPVRIVVFLAAALASLPLGFAGFVMGFGWAIAAAILLLVLARGVIEITAAKGAAGPAPLA